MNNVLLASVAWVAFALQLAWYTVATVLLFKIWRRVRHLPA
jgi:hypothetical protein